MSERQVRRAVSVPGEHDVNTRGVSSSRTVPGTVAPEAAIASGEMRFRRARASRYFCKNW